MFLRANATIANANAGNPTREPLPKSEVIRTEQRYMFLHRRSADRSAWENLNVFATERRALRLIEYLAITRCPRSKILT